MTVPRVSLVSTPWAVAVSRAQYATRENIVVSLPVSAQSVFQDVLRSTVPPLDARGARLGNTKLWPHRWNVLRVQGDPTTTKLGRRTKQPAAFVTPVVLQRRQESLRARCALWGNSPTLLAWGLTQYCRRLAHEAAVTALSVVFSLNTAKRCVLRVPRAKTHSQGLVRTPGTAIRAHLLMHAWGTTFVRRPTNMPEHPSQWASQMTMDRLQCQCAHPVRSSTSSMKRFASHAPNMLRHWPS